MAVTLYGPWWLEAVFGETQSDERFTITGSDSADGVYDKRPLSVGIGTAPGMVSGASWNITFEFSPFGFFDIGQVGPFVIGDWYQSGIVRSATYTVKDYLVMTLSADYPTRPNYAERPDHGGRALVITCKSLDPSLRPGSPVVNPYDFTLPRETLAKYHRRHKQRPTKKQEARRLKTAVRLGARCSYESRAEIIRKNADRLRPLLDEKVHLTVSTNEAFGPADDRLFENRLNGAGIRSNFRYLEGRAHFDLDPADWKPVHGGLLEQIFTEIGEAAQ